MQGETSLGFAAGHPAFAGHFPGQPIVPGVLLLDAAVYAVQQALAAGGVSTTTCQVQSAKFLSPVAPGETLQLSWSESGTGQVRFGIAGPGRQVATGVLGFAGPA
ncbi:MAG: 3-hydroxyacyl-ACP dehydratase FabZ family protein [Polaromonas sp.]|uniref:3-hydroxyacyl-ACP dehydratase FabZ family protein n=1 Tax=Polaromonas sp. TaxID=1869339 RepID=UPI0040362212